MNNLNVDDDEPTPAIVNSLASPKTSLSSSPKKGENLNVIDIKADTLTDIILREIISHSFV